MDGLSTTLPTPARVLLVVDQPPLARLLRLALAHGPYTTDLAPTVAADDHRIESLRGKEGTAAVTVKEVKEKILPALDDEFAKSLGEFETLDALRA